MSSSRTKWETFFKDAHIPTKQAMEYATTFSDNRVRLDMLDELSKELLHDLGIKAVGDVIAILRHAKIKYAELSRERSLSPEVVEKPHVKNKTSTSIQPIAKLPQKPLVKSVPSKTNPKAVASKAQPTRNIPTIPIKDAVRPVNVAALRITTSQTSTSPTRPKTGRMKLSDRFNDFQREQKRRKLEEEEEEEKEVHEKQVSKQKSTTFTIQVPKRLPSTNNTDRKLLGNTTPKVTLVPAQGKALNRNKQSTSIFDRLEKTVSAAVVVDAPPSKQNVFNRLGGMNTTTNIAQPVQKVSAMIQNNAPQSGTQKIVKTSSSVFNRLGSRQ